MTFEIGRAVESVVRRGDRVGVRREQRAHFVAVPDVELSLLALAVGIEARVEGAIAGAHLARHPADDAARDVGKPRIAGHLREIRVQAEQRPVVVEHLLEVRNRPLRIDAVAAEAAAQLIVDAAVGHPRERDADDGERIGVVRAHVLAQAELEIGRVRKLGRGAEAAVFRVEPLLELRERRGRSTLPAAHRVALGCGLEARERVLQLRRLLGDVGAPLAIGRGDARQKIEEARQAVAALLREIGSRRKTARLPASGTSSAASRPSAAS